MQSKPKKRKFKINNLLSVADRANNYSGWGDEDYSEYDKKEIEDTGKLHGNQSISLSSLLALIEKEKQYRQIDTNDIFFTASFSEDYLCLEVVEIKKLSKKEQEQEYQVALQKEQELLQQQQEQQKSNLENQLKNIQEKLNNLNKGK